MSVFYAGKSEGNIAWINAGYFNIAGHFLFLASPVFINRIKLHVLPKKNIVFNKHPLSLYKRLTKTKTL